MRKHVSQTCQTPALESSYDDHEASNGIQVTGREHVAIGAGSTFVVLAVAQVNGHPVATTLGVSAVAVAAAGSLGPDLDHPRSLASATIPAALITYSLFFLMSPWVASWHPLLAGLDLSGMGPRWTIAAWMALAAGVTLFLLSWILGAAFGHRGPVHSLGFGAMATAALVVVLVLFRLPLWLALPYAWGWIAHLVADSTTARGLQHAFWPLNRGAP